MRSYKALSILLVALAAAVLFSCAVSNNRPGEYLGVPAAYAQAEVRVRNLADFESGGLKVVLRGDLNGQYQLRLTPSDSTARTASGLSAEVFRIAAPERLIVDVPGFRTKAAEHIDVVDARLAAVRTGVHPDKLRIVVDTKTDAELAVVAGHEPDSSTLVVDFTVGQGSAVAERLTEPKQLDSGFVEATPSPRPFVEIPPEEALKELPPDNSPSPIDYVAPAPPAARTPLELLPEKEQLESAKVGTPPAKPDQPVLVLSEPERLAGEEEISFPEPTPPLEPSEVSPPLPPPPSPSPSPSAIEEVEETVPPVSMLEPETPPEPAPRIVPSQAPSPEQDGFAGVEGIFYRIQPGSGAKGIMISVKELDTYSLSRRKSNLWILTLPKAKLVGRQLGHPQFPPEDFVGFEVVLARQREDSVEVRIFVAEGTQLLPFRVKETLWLTIAGR